MQERFEMVLPLGAANNSQSSGQCMFGSSLTDLQNKCFFFFFVCVCVCVCVCSALRLFVVLVGGADCVKGQPHRVSTLNPSKA